ncbi:adenylate cyclase [Vibrio variabilis]|uniref:Adenylate cyclase n=1 Tax=Vibrio variabilis TaxID=990271 RepID=A0ABQ0JMN3_9VIBR|nr:adenylate cyclase [Vibrio variabilis]
MQAYTQTLIQRLDTLNQQRIERALALMDLQGQRVFQLIPALFHFNHPIIPGFYEAESHVVCLALKRMLYSSSSLTTSP